MAPGGKFFFDAIVGKPNRHRLEDRERMQRGRAMGIPPHQLAMMAPGDMPHRALPPTAYPLHRNLTYPAQQAAIQCVCGSLLSPVHQRHAHDCPFPLYRDPHPRAAERRHNRAHLPPRHRQRALRFDRPEHSDDEDDEDYDDELGLAPWFPEDVFDDDDDDDYDDEDDVSILPPSAFTEDRRSYERQRPRFARRFGQHHGGGRRHTALGFGGMFRRDPRAGLMGHQRFGREREVDAWGGRRRRFDDGGSLASTHVSW
ncbi:MAG: hypothetical protein Q9182_004849 [Xanthomendoza sp. 2 TL-2023]